MKKTMFMLVAVVAMVIGLTACGSPASKFVDAINDATEKVNSAKSESEMDAIGDDFEAQCKEFENDDKELSADEKTEIVNALSDLVAAMGCKNIEFAGQTLDADTKDKVKSYSKIAVENLTKDCKSIKDIIAAFEALAN